MTDLNQKIKQIKELMACNPKPPFKWSQCYEMPSGDIHWALVDPDSEEQGKVSSCYMILEANYPITMSGWTIAKEPLPKLVVDALNLLPELIAFYEAHCEEGDRTTPNT